MRKENFLPNCMFGMMLAGTIAILANGFTKSTITATEAPTTWECQATVTNVVGHVVTVDVEFMDGNIHELDCFVTDGEYWRGQEYTATIEYHPDTPDPYWLVGLE